MTAETSVLPQAAVSSSERPIAVIDIGSNSVRLVAFDRLDRSPFPTFNEKSLCGLGNGVITTGKLSKAGIDRALVALRRFRVLTQIMGIEDVRIIATAAARDATNGPEFIAAAHEALGGIEISLLSGTREAKLSAYGVMSGVYEPDGVVGDLGGGSLEIIDVKRGVAGEGVSLPLGGLALMDASNNSPKVATKIVRDALAKCEALGALAGRTFFAVGGTWRSLAKLHMGQRDYPLMVMHGYAMSARDAAELADLVERADASTFLAMASINAARRPLLAYGAVVLDELIRRAKPSQIVISTSGVREGLLYDALDAAQRRDDPLIKAAQKLNVLLSRSSSYAGELIGWVTAFFVSVGLDETSQDKRLRDAGCYLSEISWRAHPDYRGIQSSNLVSSAFLPGVDHAGRSFISLVSAIRHVGLDDDVVREIKSLMSASMIERAQIVGACCRVGSVLAAGVSGVLPLAPLSATKAKIVLTLPAHLADLENERLFGRLKALAKLLGREPVISVA